MIPASLKALFGASLVALAASAAAQKTELTGLHGARGRPDQGLRGGLHQAEPEHQLKWVQDSTGVITAKLLAEKANPQADVVMGVAASSLALLDSQGMLVPYAPLNLDAIMAAYRDKKNPPAWCGHGRLGRDGLLQHRRGAEEGHPQARDLEGPDQAGLQGPDRDAESRLRRAPASSTSTPGSRSGATTTARAAAGSTWTRCTRTSPSTRTRARSRATWPAPANTWSASRSNTAPTPTRPRARRSTSSSPRKASGWDLEAFAIHKGTKNLEAAKKLADWASSKDAMQLYGKNFAITAQPGVAAPLANVPADYEKRLVKLDFKVAAENRDARARGVERSATAPSPSRRSRKRRRPDRWMSDLRLRTAPAIRKSFGGFTGAARHRPGDLARRVRLLPRPFRLRQDDAAAHHRRARDADRRPDPAGRARHLAAAAGAARLRHRLPVVRAVSQSHGRRQRRLRPRQPARRQARASRRASTSCCSWSACRAAAPSSRPSSRAASSSASRWRARWRPSPGLLLLDEPLSALDALERVRLRQEIRSLQQKLGVTTIMVTHDQEEALSVADRIVVMNQGVIEQVGTPLEIYRDPATPFVADFVGKINVLPGACTRRRPAHRQHRFACERDTDQEREVKVYLRPEDVLARPIAAGDPHVFDGAIDKIEFLGSYCLVRVHAESIGNEPLTVYLSLNYLAEQGLSVGSRCRSRCCPSGCGSSEPCPCRPSCPCPPSAPFASARTGPTASRTRRCSRSSRCAGRLPRAAAGDDPRQGDAGQRRPIRRPRQLRQLPAHAGAAAVVREQRVGVAAGHRGRGADGVLLRLCADAQLHPGERRCFAPSR